MDKLAWLKDKYNSLTPFYKFVVIAAFFCVLLFFLLLNLSLFIPKKITPKKVPPPIPVFNPSPSAQVSTLPIRPGATPAATELQGLSVSSPAVKDNFIYYLSDGQTTFYKASLDGKVKQPLTDTLVAQIKEVIWSPDKSAAILKIENNKYFLGKNSSPFLSEEDDNLALTNWYYHFADKSFKKLDSRIGPIDFSADGSLIAYLKKDSDGSLNKLYTASADGSNEQFVTTLEESIQDNLIFLDRDNILTYAHPDGYGKNFIYLTNLVSKTSQKLTSDGLTFGAKPSPKRNFVLAQTVKEDPEVFYRSFLSVIEVPTKKLTVLDIQTSPDLAAWSADSKFIYAYESGKLRRIDAASLAKESIDLPAQFSSLKIDKGSMIVSEDNSTLFFASSGKLYRLPLKQ